MQNSRVRTLLRRRRRANARRDVPVPWPMMLHPLPPPFFHLFQALLLFGREVLRDLAMGLVDCVPDTAAGIATDFFNFLAGLVDDRPDLGHLLIGQPKLPSQSVFHGLSEDTARMLSKHEVMTNGRGHEHAGRAAGNKDQQETGDQFPLQRAIHCETSSVMAESS